MSIYDYDVNYVQEKLLPPLLRTPIRLAWLKTLIYPLQVKYNDIYSISSFKKSFPTFNKWSSVTSYLVGNRIRYGIAIYECMVANTNVPPPTDDTTWLLIEKDFVGTDERVKFNSQHMVFEYVLNRYLNVTYATIPKIYTLNNTIDVNSFLVGYDGDASTGKAATPTNQTDFIGTSYSLNQNAFTIYVPAALFLTLGNNTANREQTVRNVADKYVLAGLLYNVVPY